MKSIERLTEINDNFNELRKYPESEAWVESLQERQRDLWSDLREWSHEPWRIEKEKFVNHLARIDEIMNILETPKAVRQELQSGETPVRSIRSRGE